MTNSKGARLGPLATNQPPVVADSSNGADRPTPAQLLAQGTGFLTRTDLEQLGLSRRATDAIFRACDVIVLPGHSRPMVTVESFRAVVEASTYRGDRVR
jgi:hypothetical protein